MNAWIEHQQFFFQLFQPAWGHPVELTKQVQGHGLLGAARTVFHFDGNAQAFTRAAQALNAFCAALADHLSMRTTHQLRVEATITCHQFGVGQHRSTDLFQLRMG